MKKIFASGSCRLLETINDGRTQISPLHSMYNNFRGENFLGKLHNVKQHIQFLKYIKNEIDIPENILQDFLTSYSSDIKLWEKFPFCTCEDPRLLPMKLWNIQYNFETCDVYIFEICSIKIYEKDTYQVQSELVNENISYKIQTKEELINDLKILIGMVPKNKTIIFQSHFRPNIIYNDESKKIEHREIIFESLKEISNQYSNVIIYDPSEIIKTDISYFDGQTHFTKKGFEKNFISLINKI
jgi:hypothetical protein